METQTWLSLVVVVVDGVVVWERREGLKPNPVSFHQTPFWFQKVNQFEPKSGCFVLMFEPPLNTHLKPTFKPL